MNSTASTAAHVLDPATPFDAKRNFHEWLLAVINSGRNHRMLTRLVESLRASGLDASYDTLAKAKQGVVPLPAKYVLPLADAYGLSPAQTRQFAIAAILAHAPAELSAQMVAGMPLPIAPNLRACA